MHDAGGVGDFKRIRNLHAVVNHLVDRHGLALDAVLEGAALEVLHDDVVTIGLFTNVVNGADVGMVESRGGAGFALEALAGLGVVGEFVGKEFESDAAAETEIFRLVDHAHASPAELLQDAIVGDSLSEHGRPARREFQHGRRMRGGSQRSAKVEWKRLRFWCLRRTGLLACFLPSTARLNGKGQPSPPGSCHAQVRFQKGGCEPGLRGLAGQAVAAPAIHFFGTEFPAVKGFGRISR